MTIFVINNNIMTFFGTYIRDQRSALGRRIREIAMEAGVDSSLITRYEQGTRLPPAKQLPALARAYALPLPRMRVEWLASRLLLLVEEDPDGPEAWMVAESRMEYLRAGERNSPTLPDAHMASLLECLDNLRMRWRSCHLLDALQLARMESWFRTLYTYESNRIEGNTLTLQETELVVNQGLTIGGKTMQEHLEAINHAAAVDYLLELVRGNEPFGPRVLRELHRLILQGIAPQHAGRYRQVPVRIGGSRHEPPQPWLLDKLMEDYFTFYQRQEGRMHPVLLAAEMHERLVTIHPFIDGNGRTSRLVMNLILLRNGYTIVNLKGDPASRLAYYQALEAVQLDNRPEIFQTLILEHAITSLEEHLALT
jgi:fido (protein-threonine AMPylation protein)/transcriptional regulator with XRE-family HTH domain